MIKVKYDNIEFNILLDWKVIGIQLSGGADSALLAYILAKSIVDNNLDIKLRRLTYGFGNKFDFFPTAKSIQDKITSMVKKDVWVKEYEVFYNEKHMHSTTKTLIYLFKNKMICHTMNGRTKNPPIEELPDPANSRVLHRDNPVLIIDRDITEPFYNLTKDILLKTYIDLEITDLFDITCSCDIDRNKQILPPCGACWWCRERKWAIAKLRL